jgi:hypothetical protein
VSKECVNCSGGAQGGNSGLPSRRAMETALLLRMTDSCCIECAVEDEASRCLVRPSLVSVMDSDTVAGPVCVVCKSSLQSKRAMAGLNMPAGLESLLDSEQVCSLDCWACIITWQGEAPGSRCKVNTN